jgi:hypothetical protein
LKAEQSNMILTSDPLPMPDHNTGRNCAPGTVE